LFSFGVNMPRKKLFKTLKLEEGSFSQLEFICDRLNMKKSVFLRLLLESVFDIFSNIRKGTGGISFDVSGDKLVITSHGKNIVVSGAGFVGHDATDKEVDSEVQDLVTKGFEINKGD
jgi:hypothetical protein